MTEAEHIEELQRQNAGLRLRVQELEQARRQKESAAAPVLPLAGELDLTQHLSWLFEQAPIVILETSMDLQTRLWNQTAERTFGYSAREMLGKNPYTTLFPSIDQAELHRRMQDAERDATEKTRLLAELDQKLEVIAHQHRQILDLSAPILDIWDGVLLLPLIGRLDGPRVTAVIEVLLQAVVGRRTRTVILDMTSLEMLDTLNVGYIGTVVQALRLLGVRSIITGINPSTAQTMVNWGVDLQGVRTVRDLQQGLRACLDPGRSQKRPG